MTTIAVNGSPRKNWNTYLLLEKALEGAASKGAKTELVNIYDLNYKGCLGCLECKRKDGTSIGKCVVKDDLSPLFDKIAVCDALILGSPIYFGEITGMMRAFLERLLFQYLSYNEDRTPLTPKQIPTAFIYTMNVSEDLLGAVGYDIKFKTYKELLERILGPSRILLSTETLQIQDYDKYHMTMFDADDRKYRRDTVFSVDCQKAFEMGAEMASRAP